MSRRRRRFKVRSSSVELFAIVFNLLLLIGGSSAAQSSPSIVYGLCKTLPANISRQLKLCRFVSYSVQADEAVANGASRGLAECRNQFRSERWNCTHAAGDHHLLTSKLTQSVGNRESSFLQAILAAGIVHSISTACSTGSLNDCACDKSRMGTFGQREQTWKWGGCSSNIRHGLFYAKHLVDLLDAVHDYHNQHHHQMQRSLSVNDQNHRQTRRHHNNNNNHHHHHHQHRHLIDKRSVTLEQEGNFCLAQNISQTTHIQLVKSLLAKNSLERHPNFRLAMNAHNNRVGRMTVSKQMVRKCRCHGLSGSCSLKTCWMELNEFKEIGKELKRKYEASIHLPTAINVNRLIPMMDRNEISIILQQQQQHEQQPQVQEGSIASSQPSTMTPTSELPAAASGNIDNLRAANSPGFAPLQPEAWTSGEMLSPPARLNFYERHKQLEQRLSASSLVPAPVLNGGMPPPNHHHHQQQPQQQQQQQNATSLFLHGEEVPVYITPMSHLQYQALLRDLKLCNGNASSSPLTPTILTRSGHLSTRDLHQFDSRLQPHQVPLVLRNQLGRKSMVTNNEIGANKLATITNHKQVTATSGQNQPSQLQPVQVPAQLSQLLQAGNRDELVYLHKSPDYCEADLRHGYAGVKARQCSMEPQAPDSCDRLCCGRGYERREIELRYNCDCKFQYCCEIHCNVCQKMLVEFVCK